MEECVRESHAGQNATALKKQSHRIFCFYMRTEEPMISACRLLTGNNLEPDSLVAETSLDMNWS